MYKKPSLSARLAGARGAEYEGLSLGSINKRIPTPVTGVEISLQGRARHAWEVESAAPVARAQDGDVSELFFGDGPAPCVPADMDLAWTAGL